MTDEEIEKIKKELSNERDERNVLISQARDFHIEKQFSSLKDYSVFVIKLGEISLIVGAAITPIVIVSSDEIPFSKFVFTAIILYLFNGIIAIWSSKNIIEKQLDAFAPGNLHALEKQVYPMQLAVNKILMEFKDDDIKDYIRLKKDFLVNNTEEKTSKTINFLLDILVIVFVIASLLLTRTVWPFSSIAYWHFLGGTLIVVLILVVFGIFRAKSIADKNEQNTKDLNKIKLDYVKWWKKTIYKENE